MKITSLVLASIFILAGVFVYKPCIMAKASPDIYQGDLLLSGNEVHTIENQRFDINGSIVVQENATLILRNAIINFTQSHSGEHNMTFCNAANGNPRLLAENTTLTSSFWFEVDFDDNSSGTLSETTMDSMITLQLIGSSAVSAFNSTFRYVVLSSNSSLSLSSSTIYDYVNVFPNLGLPLIQAENSTINSLYLIITYAGEYRFSNFNPGYHDSWSYNYFNASVYGLPRLYFVRSTINNWDMIFAGNCEAKIIDSTIRDITCYESEVWLINVTINPSYIQCDDKSSAFILWYISVHVVDSLGQDVEAANVTATTPEFSLEEWMLTDVHGWAKFSLMEKWKNATGEYPVGSHAITAEYETHSNSTEVYMTENKVVTLQLAGLIIPEFPPFFALSLFVILTSIAVLMTKKKHRHSPPLKNL